MMTSPTPVAAGDYVFEVDAGFPAPIDGVAPRVRLMWRPTPWDGMPSTARNFKPVAELTARGSVNVTLGAGEAAFEFSPNEIASALESDTSLEAAEPPEPIPTLYQRIADLEQRVTALEEAMEGED